MSTKAIIGVVVLAVVVLGGAWYLSGMHGASGAPGSATGTAGSDSGTGTFATLMALGGSLECQVTVTTAQGPSTGTVYVSDGNVRSDVSAETSAGAMMAHMIKADDTIYSWTDAYPQGVKMAYQPSAPSSGNTQGGYDPNAQVQYSCAPWAADASKFVPPADVTFMDMSAMPHGAMPVNGGTAPTPPSGQPNVY